MFDIINSLYTEITSNKSVVVNGCDGIVDYNDTSVILKSSRTRVVILGTNLKIKVMTENSAVIEGYISSVNFEKS